MSHREYSRVPQNKQHRSFPFHTPGHTNTVNINTNITDKGRGLQHVEEGDTAGPRDFHSASRQRAITTPESYRMVKPSISNATLHGSLNPLQHIHYSSPDHKSSNILPFEHSTLRPQLGSRPGSSAGSTGASHELMKPSGREDAETQWQCRDTLCKVCKADHGVHVLEYFSSLEVFLCKCGETFTNTSNLVRHFKEKGTCHKCGKKVGRTGKGNFCKACLKWMTE